MQNEYGDAALIGACQGGHVETARVLLDYGANVDLQNNVRKNNTLLLLNTVLWPLQPLQCITIVS